MLKASEKPAPSPLEGESTFSEGNRWNRWLFPRPVLRSFEAGRRALHTLPNSHRDLLHLALPGAAMDCCNGRGTGNACDTKPTGVSQRLRPVSFVNVFALGQTRLLLTSLRMPLTESQSCVIEGDARRLLLRMSSETFTRIALQNFASRLMPFGTLVFLWWFKLISRTWKRSFAGSD